MTKIRSSLLIAALVALAACGSDDGADPAADEATAGDVLVDDAPADDAPADDATPTGTSTGMLTMDDGTVYSLEMTTCETSENGAEGFPIENGFDLFGRTADGKFTAQFIRAGFDDENVVVTAALEGDFDDEGKNAQLIYSKVADTMDAIVDGGNVSGTVTMRPIGPNRPHGDEIATAFEVSC